MNNILNYHFFTLYLSAVLLTCVYIIAYKSFSNNKLKINLNNAILILITAFIISINNLYNPILAINALISAITYMIMYKLIINESWKTTFCKTCLMTLVSFVLDPVLSIIISFACENIQELNVNTIPKLVMTFTFSYAYYKIFKSEKNRIRFKSILDLMENNKKILMFLVKKIII